MAEPLENLARRLEDDPFFLACPLQAYAKSEELDDRQLADKLHCSAETLTLVRLCRAPAGDAAPFQADVARIASKFQLDADVLTEAVRRGQALWSFRQEAAAKTLIAARDLDQDDSRGGLT